MAEITYDKTLRIKTIGKREWQDQDESVAFHRYEATPYRALDILFQHHQLQSTAQVVDFGSGRGRVAFYIHDRFQVSVTGVEINELTHAEALQNATRYNARTKQIKAPLRFVHGLAEAYRVQPADSCFYFFNPFPATTFSQVVSNILQSVQQVQRSVELILYYPLPKYVKFLEKNTPFTLSKEILVPRSEETIEKFLVYRL